MEAADHIALVKNRVALVLLKHNPLRKSIAGKSDRLEFRLQVRITFYLKIKRSRIPPCPTVTLLRHYPGNEPQSSKQPNRRLSSTYFFCNFTLP